jgi:hypothetical protein
MASLRVLALATYYQAATCLALFVLGLVLWRDGVWAILAGGCLMTVNFIALRLLAARALSGSSPRLAYGVALGGKLVLVAGVLALFILVLDMHVLGLAVGMSSLFFGIGLATAHTAFSARPAVTNPNET